MSHNSYLLGEEPVVELDLLAAMVAELEEYIIKDELYRTLIASTSAGDRQLTMTGGDMLTRFYRLQHEDDQLSREQQNRVAVLEKQAESTIYSLKTRFNQRLVREMKARLDSLTWYLDDCATDRQRCRTNYPFEIRNRQRIEEILKRIGDDLPDDLRSRLQSVDKRILLHAAGSEFVWEDRLAPVFPKSVYWYLYMRP